jgi:hypothetical protein
MLVDRMGAAHHRLLQETNKAVLAERDDFAKDVDLSLVTEGKESQHLGQEKKH